MNFVLELAENAATLVLLGLGRGGHAAVGGGLVRIGVSALVAILSRFGAVLSASHESLSLVLRLGLLRLDLLGYGVDANGLVELLG